jgi:hypothetical protein
VPGCARASELTEFRCGWEVKVPTLAALGLNGFLLASMRLGWGTRVLPIHAKGKVPTFLLVAFINAGNDRSLP